MMQAGRRHVLIFDKRPVVKRVLAELSAGVESDGGVRREIRRGLEEFAKHGGVRLILDLQGIKPPIEGKPAAIRNFSAYLVGDVLIITGQATFQWMLRILQIRANSRRHFFPANLPSVFSALTSRALVEIETAALRIASPIRRTLGSLGRAHARY
jgi:hypothetical protein